MIGLPSHGDTVSPILREEVVKDGRAGARHANDHDGRLNALLRDFWVRGSPMLQLQAVLETHQNIRPGNGAADRRELRLFAKRLSEDLEPLEEPGVAKVPEARRALSGAEQRLGFERQLGKPAREWPCERVEDPGACRELGCFEHRPTYLPK